MDWRDSPNRLGSSKDPKQRERWSLRGTFQSLGEAVEIAKSYDPPRYVAMGPEGGYSVFPRREVPWGDVESEDTTLWPAGETVVFLPPTYEPEPGNKARRVGKIGD